MAETQTAVAASQESVQAVLLRMIREAEDRIKVEQIRIGALKEGLRAVESVR